MTYTVKLSKKSQKDYLKLDYSQRFHIDKSIERLEHLGMQAGEALSGKLSGCRKLKHKKLGLRVIFRQTDKGIEIIEIIAIGRRQDSKVYKEAEKRIKENYDTR